MAVQNINRSSVEWTNFNKFVDFTKQEGVKNDTVAKFEWKTASKKDFTLERSTSDKIHNFKRSELAKEVNDLVRAQFSNAVCKLFGIKDGKVDKLPPDIKKAMVLDDYGKGKPLSARRIKAVSAAIENWDVCPARFKVPKHVQNEDLGGIQCELDSVCGSDDGYKKQLGQIVKDVNRHSLGNGKSTRLSLDAEKRFQTDPNARYSEKKGVLAYMLNGKQYPIDPTGRKQITTSDVEKFIQKQFPVDTNDQDAVKLRKAVVSFSHQGVFSLGTKDVNPNGLILGDKTTTGCQVVNIVRSPDKKGYDVIVQQKFFDVPGLDTKKEGAAPDVLFDPMRPGEYSVTTTYRLSMKSGRPVVSYAKKPEVQTKFFKPITAEGFKTQTAKFAKAHLKEILSSTKPDTRKWWNGMIQKDQDKALEGILNSFHDSCLETGVTVSVKALASEFDQHD